MEPREAVRGSEAKAAGPQEGHKHPRRISWLLAAVFFSILPVCLAAPALPPPRSSFAAGILKSRACMSSGFVGGHTPSIFPYPCHVLRRCPRRTATVAAATSVEGSASEGAGPAVHQALQAAYGDRDSNEFWAYRDLAFEQVWHNQWTAVVHSLTAASD